MRELSANCPGSLSQPVASFVGMTGAETGKQQIGIALSKEVFWSERNQETVESCRPERSEGTTEPFNCQKK
jgi:hypothetical protein